MENYQTPQGLKVSEQLRELKTLVNQLRGNLDIPLERSTKRKCRALYGRTPASRTWRSWKTLAMATNRPWDYAASVCLRFIAIGRAGNRQREKLIHYDRAELVQSLLLFLEADEPESLLISPQIMTGAEVERYLEKSLGKCSQRQWRNRGVYRRELYTPNQIDQILEKTV